MLRLGSSTKPEDDLDFFEGDGRMDGGGEVVGSRSVEILIQFQHQCGIVELPVDISSV